MQKIKRLFLPWNYLKEQESANIRSREGFHLVKSGCFSRTEQEDPAVCYRYLLDCRETGGLTELYYEKQGWETVCTQGKWIWFRKKAEENRMESEYVLHCADRHAVEDHLRRILRRLERFRNLLLIVTLILLLIPGEFTADWTPRVGCVPLFLCILPVKAAGNIRSLFGEERTK